MSQASSRIRRSGLDVMQQVSEEVSGSFGGCCGSDEDACKYHEQSHLRHANLAARIPPRSDAVGSECFTSHLQSWRCLPAVETVAVSTSSVVTNRRCRYTGVVGMVSPAITSNGSRSFSGSWGTCSGSVPSCVLGIQALGLKTWVQESGRECKC
jgi:hypothetical protein